MLVSKHDEDVMHVACVINIPMHTRFPPLSLLSLHSLIPTSNPCSMLVPSLVYCRSGSQNHNFIGVHWFLFTMAIYYYYYYTTSVVVCYMYFCLSSNCAMIVVMFKSERIAGGVNMERERKHVSSKRRFAVKPEQQTHWVVEGLLPIIERSSLFWRLTCWPHPQYW